MPGPYNEENIGCGIHGIFMPPEEWNRRASPNNTWISVQERLGPRHKDVLCLNRDGNIFTGRVCYGMHEPFWTIPRNYDNPSNTAPAWIDVTHWMPLPLTLNDNLSRAT